MIHMKLWYIYYLPFNINWCMRSGTESFGSSLIVSVPVTKSIEFDSSSKAWTRILCSDSKFRSAVNADHDIKRQCLFWMLLIAQSNTKKLVEKLPKTTAPWSTSWDFNFCVTILSFCRISGRTHLNVSSTRSPYFNNFK